MLKDLSISLLSSSLCLLPVLVILFLFKGKKPRTYKYVFHFIILFYLSELIGIVGVDLQRSLWPQLSWNWIGKLLILVLQAGYVLLIWKPKAWELGWRRPELTSPKALLALLLGLLIIGLKFYTNYKDPVIETVNTERWLNQLSMPGLQEEFSYRAVYWALLLRFLNIGKLAPDSPPASMPFFIVLPITLLFAMAHAISIDNSFHIGFGITAFVSALLGGFVYSLLRWSTRSILIPIFFHNLLNGSICLAQAIK